MQNKSGLNRPVSNFYILIISTLALSVIGLVMVFSASSIHSLQINGNSFGIMLRQLIFLVISIPCALFISRISLSRWKALGKRGLLLSILLLLILLIPGVGKTVNGNTNWIDLKFVDIQPSEIAKFLMIIWAANVLSRHEAQGRTTIPALKLLTPGFIIVMALVMLGADLGTASVIAIILGGLLFISGLPIRLLGTLTALGFFTLAGFVATSGYRMERFLVAFHPFQESDYMNAGWQPAHSLLSLASGGLFGVGLGGSRQKWGNLAEAHTDFIFSVIGEELGLLGTLTVLVLLAALIFSIFKISLRTQDSFSRYATAGIGVWITIQTILNVGSATSVLPVVGVTLPLVSYGGSALISTYIALGFALGTALRDPEVARDVRERLGKRRLNSL